MSARRLQSDRILLPIRTSLVFEFSFSYFRAGRSNHRMQRTRLYVTVSIHTPLGRVADPVVGHHSPPVSSERLVPAFQESSQQRREPFDGGLYRIVCSALLTHVRLVDAATHDGLTDMAVFLSTDDAFGEQTTSALPLADVAGFHRFAWHFDFHICFEFDVMPNHALQRTTGSRLGLQSKLIGPPSLSLGR